MATTSLELVTKENKIPRVIIDENDALNRAKDNNNYRLISALQSTLDVELLLEIFSNELSSILGPHSLRLRHDEQDIDFVLGRPSSHQVSYRLILLDQYLGKMTIYRKRAFTEDEILRFESMLTTFAYPLRNALLYKTAVNTALTDPLTGARNRLAMAETLTREMSLARRNKSELAILMLDADFFKRINDKYGHIAGDSVLKGLVECISECVRGSDMVFRYGGEEFTVILQNTDMEGAMLLAERIRELIENHVFIHKQSQLKVTASIGVSVLTSDDDYLNLIEKADSALYKAKKNGRNQISNLA